MIDFPEILVIDDDLAFVAAIKTHFVKHGIGVATISDAILTSAVDFERFKIVLLDLQMPGRSGKEVLAQIPSGRRPVVIMMSVHSDLATRIQLLDRGADFFLSKPVDLTEVLFVCRRILGRQVIVGEPGNRWVLSRARHTLASPKGTVFGLTVSEFRILELVFEASPEVVTKEVLTKAVTAREGSAGIPFYRSLEVMISRMRTRFSAPELALPIRALRNVGYIFHGHGAFDDSPTDGHFYERTRDQL